MYSFFDLYIDSNGYVLTYIPFHPRAISSGSFKGYVYEHIVVAENILGRPLLTGDVVHHLDKNRSNNSPDNLLILSGPMHGKLHRWLDKNIITPIGIYQERIQAGCIRCNVCHTPIDFGFIYCSEKCKHAGQTKYERPSKEILEKLIWEKPTMHLAKEFGVSDVAISKLCKTLGIEKPPRGYWTKKKFEKV